MPHTPYAPFSLECPKEIIRMVSGRTVRNELPLFAKCVHTIAGTALGATIGEPADVEPLVFGSDDVTIADLEEVKAALKEVKEEPTFGAGEGDEAIDPATLMLLIDLAIKLITKLIERRKQGS